MFKRIVAVVACLLFLVGAAWYIRNDEVEVERVIVVDTDVKPKGVSVANTNTNKPTVSSSSIAYADTSVANAPVESIRSERNYEADADSVESQRLDDSRRQTLNEIDSALSRIDAMMSSANRAMNAADAALANSTTFNTASARYMRENYPHDVTWETLKNDPVYIRLLTEDVEAYSEELLRDL